MGLSLATQGLAHTLWSGDYKTYQALVDSSLKLLQEVGDRWYLARFYGDLGDYYLPYRHDDAQSEKFHQQCVSLFQETGDRWSARCSLIALNWIYGRERNMAKFREASALLAEIEQEQFKLPCLKTIQCFILE